MSRWAMCCGAVLIGCGAAAQPRDTGLDVPLSEGELERFDREAEPTPDSESRANVQSTKLRAPAQDRFATKRIVAPVAPPQRHGSQRRINLSLHRAELANALRLIAEAGRLNLVVEEGVTGEVSVELKRVRAYDALVALAEAHGAVVEPRGNILIVKRRGE